MCIGISFTRMQFTRFFSPDGQSHWAYSRHLNLALILVILRWSTKISSDDILAIFFPRQLTTDAMGAVWCLVVRLYRTCGNANVIALIVGPYMSEQRSAVVFGFKRPPHPECISIVQQDQRLLLRKQSRRLLLAPFSIDDAALIPYLKPCFAHMQGIAHDALSVSGPSNCRLWKTRLSRLY